MKFQSIIFLIAALFLCGCHYEFSKPPETANESNNSGASTNRLAKNESNTANNAANSGASNKPGEPAADADSSPLILSDTGKVAIYPCNGREVEIDESATANSYTFTGECKKMTVDGVSNKIKIEKVGAISVAGTSNHVVYGEGLNGQKPKIKKSGTDTSIETIKSQEAKQNAANKQ